MLPTKFGNPLWFSDEELLELKGTSLYRATELQVCIVQLFFFFFALTSSKFQIIFSGRLLKLIFPLEADVSE